MCSRRRKMASVSNSFRVHGTADSDQAGVWRDGAELQQTLDAESETGALDDAFTAVEPVLEDYLKASPPQEDQAGVVALVHGQAVIHLAALREDRL